MDKTGADRVGGSCSGNRIDPVAGPVKGPVAGIDEWEVGMERPESWPRGPWTVLKRQCVYQDPWLRTFRDEVVRPDGLVGSYSTSHIKAGVCVIAMDEKGTVHLTKEFHYAVGRITIEGVSGGIEEGESAEEAAKRELREEIGVVPERLISLGVVDPLTSALSSPTQLFLAQELRWVEASPEGTETMEVCSLSFESALEKVMTSEISHGPTCVALLKIQLLQCGNKSL